MGLFITKRAHWPALFFFVGSEVTEHFIWDGMFADRTGVDNFFVMLLRAGIYRRHDQSGLRNANSSWETRR